MSKPSEQIKMLHDEVCHTPGDCQFFEQVFLRSIHVLDRMLRSINIFADLRSNFLAYIIF